MGKIKIYGVKWGDFFKFLWNLDEKGHKKSLWI